MCLEQAVTLATDSGGAPLDGRRVVGHSCRARLHEGGPRRAEVSRLEWLAAIASPREMQTHPLRLG